jgi:hypothetical protein
MIKRTPQTVPHAKNVHGVFVAHDPDREGYDDFYVAYRRFICS